MKLSRSVLLIVIGLTLAAGIGGCSKHYVDVYINEQCIPVTLENDRGIETLYVYPGDYVIWNNCTGEELILGFINDWFGETTVTIPAGQRIILPVKAYEPGIVEYTIECDGGVAAPKVQLGDDP